MCVSVAKKWSHTLKILVNSLPECQDDVATGSALWWEYHLLVPSLTTGQTGQGFMLSPTLGATESSTWEEGLVSPEPWAPSSLASQETLERDFISEPAHFPLAPRLYLGILRCNGQTTQGR